MNDTAFLKKEFLEFKQEMRHKLAGFKSMGPDLSDYFPAKNNDSIEKFMQQDEQLKERKDALYFLLQGCGFSTEKQFSDSFITSLFDTEYLKKYIWPHGR